MQEPVHAARRQALEVIQGRLVALPHETVRKGLELLKRSKALPFDHLPQFVQHLSRFRRGMAGNLPVMAAVLVFPAAAAGAGIVSADLHGGTVLLLLIGEDPERTPRRIPVNGKPPAVKREDAPDP